MCGEECWDGAANQATVRGAECYFVAGPGRPPSVRETRSVPTSFCCGSTASASRLLLSADVFLRLNLVERFFAALTGDVIRAGSFASVKELFRDIKAYLAERNANPKPYKWKAEGAKILSKIKRARVALDKAEAA
jgi:hypothetical protein